ncbi:zonular occludens toxin domain-containing protein [Nitrincola alkalisediminis]|uniref:zonular occludens toxin domain-containing protein n=1 Tax=Nitrincola alkalisediminis TaxID=1366656 RepID=UPI001876E65D|nr:zonular occludens toxin domain-containing protein [Nitrincola alkalisediminis]
MIFLIMGRPGGGKSYESVAYHVIPALNEGRKVITNLPLKIDYIKAVFGSAVADLIEFKFPTKENPVPFSTLADYGDTWTHPETGVGPLYVIDECHKPLRRGKTKQDVEEWYAEHRHSKSDILLISQYHRKLDLNICDLIDIVYSLGKQTMFGSQERYVRHTKSGIRGTTLDTQVRTYDPAFFPFYQSHTASTTAGKEATVRDVKPIWKKWQFVGAALFLVSGVTMMLVSVPNMFGTKSSSQPTQSTASKTDPTFTMLSNQFDMLEGSGQTETYVYTDTLPADPAQAKANLHPFSEFQLRISGNVNSPKGPTIVIRALQNGQFAFVLTDNDLLNAGYTFDQRGDCLMHIQYQNYNGFITCGAASQSIQAAM